MTNIDDLLPPAKAMAQKLAEIEAEKAREAAEKEAKRARSKARKAVRDAAFETMCGLYAQRLRRALGDTERRVLRERLTELGPDRVGEVLFTLDATALSAWLANPDAPTK